MRQAIEITGGSILGGVHASAHAILTVLTMILTIDPSDVDCEHVSCLKKQLIIPPQPRYQVVLCCCLERLKSSNTRKTIPMGFDYLHS